MALTTGWSNFKPFYQIDDKGYQILGDLDKKVIAQGLWKLPKFVHSDSKKNILTLDHFLMRHLSNN